MISEVPEDILIDYLPCNLVVLRRMYHSDSSRFSSIPRCYQTCLPCRLANADGVEEKGAKGRVLF